MIRIHPETFVFAGILLLIIGCGFGWYGFGFKLPRWIVRIGEWIATWWKKHTRNQQIEIEVFLFCLIFGLIFLWIGMHK